MKRNNGLCLYYIKRLSAVALCFFMLTAILSLCAEAKTPDSADKLVRVGWFDSSYNTMDARGRRTGYCYEYERKIAAYTGWKYEYVEGSWVELMKMLENGEIDMLGGVSYTKEREEKFLYPSYPMGTEEYHLYISSEHIDDYTESPSYFNGKTIGVNKGSVQADMIRNWVKINHISPTITDVVTSENESVEMLLGGELDGYVTLDNYLNVDSLVPVAKIGFSDFYFALSKTRTDLLTELNSAMSKIQDENRFYDQELFVKYNQHTGANLFLNADERNWLTEHGVIRVGYIDDYLVYCDRNESTGELDGVLKDYLERAKSCFANSDVDYETNAYPTVTEALEALGRGEVDCVFPANFSDYDGEKTGTVLSPTITRAALYAVVKISGRQDFSGKANVTVAVVSSDLNFESLIKDLYPGWKIFYCDDTQACLDAVSEGTADCFLISSYRYSIIRRQCDKNKLTPLDTGRDIPFCFAVTEGNKELYSILAKTANIIPDSYINNRLSHYYSEESKPTPLELLKENIFFVVAVAAVMAAMLILIIFQRRLINAEKEAVKHRTVADDLSRRVYVDALTSVRNKGGYNEYVKGLEERIKSGEVKRYAVCMLDCDDLKYINDKFGHEKGDIYLKTATALICRTFRHSPVFRVGGDEFISILINDDYENRKDLIERFASESRDINETVENDWEHINVSLGMAEYDESLDSSVEDTAKRADEKMYENKRERKAARGVR